VSGGAGTPSERRPITRFPHRTRRYRTDISRPPDLPEWSFEICRPPYRTLQPVAKLDSVIRLEPGYGLMLVATPRGSNLEPCFGECELLRGLLPWASLVVRPSPEWAEDDVYDLIHRVSQRGALPVPIGADPARIAQRVLDAFRPEPDLELYLRAVLPGWPHAGRTYAVQQFARGFSYHPQRIRDARRPSHHQIWMQLGRATAAALQRQRQAGGTKLRIAKQAHYASSSVMERALSRAFGVTSDAIPLTEIARVFRTQISEV